MTDPQRIIDGQCGELETALMRSVRRDAPSSRARAAALSVLGIGAATLPATTSAAAAAGKTLSMAALGVAKSVAIGAGAAALVLGAVHQASKPAPTVASLPDPIGAVTIVAPAPLLAPAPPAAATVDPEIAPRAAEEATPSRARSQATFEPARGESKLSAEIAALDRARSTARGHDPAGALALLDDYERQFPGGILAVEADVLRIEALADSGQTDRAVALGRVLLRNFPSGPHAERVLSIVASIAGARDAGTIQ
jgi:hypothetical protein